MSAAILGLLGTVVSSVSNKTKAESEAEIEAFMDHNKALMDSNTLPLVMIGGMLTLGIIASAIRRR